MTNWKVLKRSGRLCGLLIRVPDCRSRGPGRFPALLGRKSSGSVLEIRVYGRRDPSYWPHGNLYPQKLALTSPTSGGRSRTQTTKLSLVYVLFSLTKITHIITILTLNTYMDPCYAWRKQARKSTKEDTTGRYCKQRDLLNNWKFVENVGFALLSALFFLAASLAHSSHPENWGIMILRNVSEVLSYTVLPLRK
jgi:hypothetical protein